MSEPKEHGIIMAASSILAYKAGRKTQTRRLYLPINRWPNVKEGNRWPNVKEGDRFWFRETHAFIWPDDCPDGRVADDTGEYEERWLRPNECRIVYRADTGDKYPGQWPDDCGDDPDCGRWKPSIHIPRWAARYTPLATADARLERLQDISEDDARAEGAEHGGWPDPANGQEPHWAFRKGFSNLWRSLHTKPGTRWEDNPMVVVLEFAGVKG